MKAARQLGQMAMKARTSRVQLSRLMECRIPVGSSAQPWGPAIAKSMDIVVVSMGVMLPMVLAPVTKIM